MVIDERYLLLSTVDGDDLDTASRHGDKLLVGIVKELCLDDGALGAERGSVDGFTGGDVPDDEGGFIIFTSEGSKGVFVQGETERLD